MKKVIFFLAILLLLQTYPQAQSGSLDLSFGINGIATTPISGGSTTAQDMCIQTDGKIILAGAAIIDNDNFCLTRYNTDGSLDSTFDSDGILITDIDSLNQSISAICLQPDGKILVAGEHIIISPTYNSVYGLVIRYNTDGSIDSTFGSNGIVFTGYSNYSPASIQLQANGNILIAGTRTTLSPGVATSQILLTRLNSNGGLDQSFDLDGIVTTYFGSFPNCSAYSMVLQPDEKILVTGYSKLSQNPDFLVARYNTNGSLDSTFNNIGYVTIDINNNSHDYSSDIILQSDGKILTGGAFWYGNQFVMVRYNSDGSLDLSFDSNGIATTPIGNNTSNISSIALQPNGKILAAGYSNNGVINEITIARYNSDGSLDLSFDLDGIVTTPIDSNSSMASKIALQSDGKILVAGYKITPSPTMAGYYTMALVRYENILTPIHHIENSTPNLFIYPNPFHSMTTIEFGANMVDAEVFIYNMFGQKVKTISNISDSMIRLNREELAAGFYVVSLIQKNKVIATDKIVITD